MITRTDIERQVDASVPWPEHRDGLDFTAIVDEIIETYGLVNIDTIGHDDYWALVMKHVGMPEPCPEPHEWPLA